MEVSIRSLRYLVAVADAGSVTGAARRLNVSQPSISYAVANLEADIGFPLFIRHRARGVSSTPAGARVVAEARHLLAHVRDFARNARSLGGEPAGDITLGCFLTVAPRYLPQLLAAFAQRHPAIRVRPEEGDQRQIIDSLMVGRTEVALAYDFALPEAADAIELAVLPAHVALPAGHRLAERERIALAELAEEPFLLLDLPHSRDYFMSLFRAKGIEPQVRFSSGSQELIRGLVGNGHGFAIQNSIARTPYASDGTRLAYVPLDADLAPVRLVLLSLTGLPARPAVGAFIGFVRDAFAPGGLFSDPQGT
ncbi:LysR family transcriptional regulator [Paracraurococcus ruber]|uniref:LysR family transcriptional regulator n=1 Tax=Paracraurococcus ruber TaxID=77675 RepID=A0ABS1D568_9PROT|nr:LysR family transcriptional regulator [Paracraurococcus ruber]MBK1661638.1 LysR family transcriptional regulator [Paracraurococcus ruber]